MKRICKQPKGGFKGGASALALLCAVAVLVHIAIFANAATPLAAAQTPAQITDDLHQAAPTHCELRLARILLPRRLRLIVHYNRRRIA